MKVKINRNIIIAILFIGIIMSLTALNYDRLVKTLNNGFRGQSIDTLQKAAATVDASYRTTFKSRNKFIDIYGLTQLGLNKKMIGNFDFLKDEQGFMHIFNPYVDTNKFNNEMIVLNNYLRDKDIPLLYVQVPSREIQDYTYYTSNMVNETNPIMDSIISNLQLNNINYLDIRQNIANNEYPKDEVYLKTDAHLKTGTEFWIMQLIANKLETAFNFDFKYKDPLDINNYTIENKKFLGNYGRSAGKYFIGLDDFELLYPKFQTNFTLTNFYSGYVKNGEFRNVVMNGLEEDDYNLYWVTDYLQWPSPYYNVENKNIKENNILIIMDSLGIRTASYLSLLCNNVTILDSRYFDGLDYITRATTTQKYDAVVIIQSTNLINFPFFPQGLQAQIISEDFPKEMKLGDNYDINITIKNTSDVIWSENELIRLCLWQDGIDYGYRALIPEGIEVKPGEEFTFTINDFQTPFSKSTYLEYQMLKEGITYFGEKKRVDISIIQ